MLWRTWLVLIFACLSRLASAESFVSHEYGFSIDWPEASPTVAESTIPSAQGDAQLFALMPANRSTNPMLMVVLFPHAAPAESEKQQILNIMGKHDKVRIVSQRDVITGNQNGKEFLLSGSNQDSYGRVQTFIVGRRLFFLIAKGSEASLRSSSTDRFFQSFAPKPEP